MKTPAQHAAFLGRGWSFPPTFDELNLGVEMAAGEEDVRQALRLIFAVNPGERQMMPEFGCNLRQFAFATLNESVLTMIEQAVQSALLHYEPRIDVKRVSVAAGVGAESRGIVITVEYVVRTSNRRYNFVYPYYLNEATGIPQ